MSKYRKIWYLSDPNAETRHKLFRKIFRAFTHGSSTTWDQIRMDAAKYLALSCHDVRV